MSYRVYLIKNREDRTYIGLSDDIERRLEGHNSRISRWTKYRGPWRLHWISHLQPTLGEARKLELLLKYLMSGAGLPALLNRSTDQV